MFNAAVVVVHWQDVLLSRLRGLLVAVWWLKL
jgi:hypothetical protein